MSFGKMNQSIQIIAIISTMDAEGFAANGETVLASVKAYKEDRHGTVAWKNRATFSTATSLFRFRIIPSLTITTAMGIVCKGERFNILSVEDVKCRGMFIEVLTERVNPNGAC